MDAFENFEYLISEDCCLPKNISTPKGEYEEFEEECKDEISAFSTPGELELKRIELKDFLGRPICPQSITEENLNLDTDFFGVSFSYRSETNHFLKIKFFENKIEMISLDLKKGSVCIKFTDKLFIKNTRENEIFEDEPFYSCLEMILHLRRENELKNVYKYIYNNYLEYLEPYCDATNFVLGGFKKKCVSHLLMDLYQEEAEREEITSPPEAESSPNASNNQLLVEGITPLSIHERNISYDPIVHCGTVSPLTSQAKRYVSNKKRINIEKIKEQLKKEVDIPEIEEGCISILSTTPGPSESPLTPNSLEFMKTPSSPKKRSLISSSPKKKTVGLKNLGKLDRVLTNIECIERVEETFAQFSSSISKNVKIFVVNTIKFIKKATVFINKEKLNVSLFDLSMDLNTIIINNEINNTIRNYINVPVDVIFSHPKFKEYSCVSMNEWVEILKVLHSHTAPFAIVLKNGGDDACSFHLKTSKKEELNKFIERKKKAEKAEKKMKMQDMKNNLILLRPKPKKIEKFKKKLRSFDKVLKREKIGKPKPKPKIKENEIKTIKEKPKPVQKEGKGKEDGNGEIIELIEDLKNLKIEENPNLPNRNRVSVRSVSNNTNTNAEVKVNEQKVGEGKKVEIYHQQSSLRGQKIKLHTNHRMRREENDDEDEIAYQSTDKGNKKLRPLRRKKVDNVVVKRSNNLIRRLNRLISKLGIISCFGASDV